MSPLPCQRRMGGGSLGVMGVVGGSGGVEAVVEGVRREVKRMDRRCGEERSNLRGRSIAMMVI